MAASLPRYSIAILHPESVHQYREHRLYRLHQTNRPAYSLLLLHQEFPQWSMAAFHGVQALRCNFYAKSSAYLFGRFSLSPLFLPASPSCLNRITSTFLALHLSVSVKIKHSRCTCHYGNDLKLEFHPIISHIKNFLSYVFLIKGIFRLKGSFLYMNLPGSFAHTFLH